MNFGAAYFRLGASEAHLLSTNNVRAKMFGLRLSQWHFKDVMELSGVQGFIWQLWYCD